MAVRFTQFLMPNGRPVPTDIELNDPLLEAKATWLRNAGYKFEIEMLKVPKHIPEWLAELTKELAGTTGPPNISMEIMKPDGEALCGRLAVNGPDVVVKVTEMITEAHKMAFGKG